MFCTKCGTEIKDGFKFCPKCGTPVFVKKEKVNENVGNTNGINEDKPKLSNDSIPLIIEELDIEGVKKNAEQGDKSAMLRQAFRYEVGIGTPKDFEKADKLYDMVGGKNSLISLEDTHVGSILPDSYYGYIENNNSSGKYFFKTLPFVKDLVLDYAYKVEFAKSRGIASDEVLDSYKDEFVNNMLVIRDRYPEFLLINTDTICTQEEYAVLFSTIKKKSRNRYTIQWIPSLFCYSDVIDGNNISVPNIIETKFDIGDKIVVSRYDPKERNLLILKQIVFSILLQLPIKKIHFFIVSKSFGDIALLFKDINSSLFDIISTKEEFSNLIRLLEERKTEISKKYRSYADYCVENKTIPIPYEIVIELDSFNSFMDNSYNHNRHLLSNYSWGNVIGTYLIEFISTSSFYGDNEGCKNLIISPARNELYSNDSLSSGKIVYQDGMLYLKQSQNVYDEGIISYSSVSNSVIGSGEYEVYIQIGPHPEFNNYNIEEIQPNSFYGKNKYKFDYRFHQGIHILGAFPTKKEAEAYYENNTIQNASKLVTNRIRLFPYAINSFENLDMGIALYIPSYVGKYQPYIDDLSFYLSLFNYELKDYLVNVLKIVEDYYQAWLGNKNGNDEDKRKLEELKNIYKYSIYPFVLDHIYHEKYIDINSENLYLIGCNICTNESGLYLNGVINQQFKSYRKNILSYYEFPEECNKYIQSMEFMLHNKAIEKWGEHYYESHLAFLDNVYRSISKLQIRKTSHYRIPILKHSPINNGLITELSQVNIHSSSD